MPFGGPRDLRLPATPPFPAVAAAEPGVSEREATEKNRAEWLGDCPNGPDEYGHYPCDPKGYFGDAECQVCGRLGAWAGRDVNATDDVRLAERRYETWLEALKDHGP